MSNLSASGPINITNANSVINLQIDEISSSGFGGNNFAYAINVKNCRNAIITVDRISDPYTYIDHLAGYEEFGDPVYDLSFTAGLYWSQGPLFASLRQVVVPGYAFYANSESATTGVIDCYLTSDLLLSHRQASVYTVGDSVNYKMWLNVKEIGSNGGEAISLFGAQSFYLTGCEKAYTTNTGSAVISFSPSPPNPSLILAWMNIQKVESSGGPWVNLLTGQTGRLDIVVMEYNDRLGTMTQGFVTAGGTNNIHGGRARIGNGKGIVHSAGRTFAENLYLDTSATVNAANIPVYVTGAGVILKDCVLKAPTGAPSVDAPTAQSVYLIGNVVASTAKGANITFTGPGTFTVDATIPSL